MERSFGPMRTIRKKRKQAFRSTAPRKRVYRGRRATYNGELKFFDIRKAATNLTAAGVILDDSICEVAQGVTESERIGRKMTIRSINFRGEWQNGLGTATGTVDGRLRIVIVWDKQANGAAFTVANVLENNGAAVDINSFRNLSNAGRFVVLMDKTFNANIPGVAQTAAGTFTSYANAHSWTFYKSCNIPIEYDAAAGAITEMRSNNVGIFALSQTPVNPGAASTVSYTCRIRFSDG